MIRLAGASSFQWSSSEQVYPFEKHSDGSTLYCKEIDIGTFPNTGMKFVNHNIPNFTRDSLFRMYGVGKSPNDTKLPWNDPLPRSAPLSDPAYNLHIGVENATTLAIGSQNSHYSDYTGIIRIIYKK